MGEEKRKLGLFTCIGIIVGGCIGSAIFSLSGQTMVYAGPAALVSWTIAALILAFYGMQVCELAVRFPQSGGIFVFPQKAIGGKLGDFWGFISAWGYIVSNFIAIAFSAIYVSVFLGQGFPALSGLQIPLALASVLLCMVLNLLKITDAGRFNNILVAALVVAMLTYIGFGLFGGGFDAANFANFFTTGGGVSGMFKSIPIAAVAYGSCVAISFMVGEVKDPNKTIPASLLIGLSIVMILYLLMIFATIATFNYGLFAQFPWLAYAPQFGAIFFGGLSAYPWLAKLIALAALFALLTTMLVVMALNVRAVKAIALSGYFPKALAKENRNGVPHYPTIICAVIAGLLSCKPDWTEILVSLGAFFNVISMSITCIALIIARKKTELAPGQYRAPLGNVASILTIVVLGSCYLIGSISANVAIFTVIIYAIAVALFFFVSSRKREA